MKNSAVPLVHVEPSAARAGVHLDAILETTGLNLGRTVVTVDGGRWCGLAKGWERKEKEEEEAHFLFQSWPVENFKS